MIKQIIRKEASVMSFHTRLSLILSQMGKMDG